MKKMLSIMFLCLMLLFLLAGCSKGAATNDDTGHLFTKNHTVTLVVEGMSDKKITIEDGKTLAVDFTPQKDNFFFAGWYTDSA